MSALSTTSPPRYTNTRRVWQGLCLKKIVWMSATQWAHSFLQSAFFVAESHQKPIRAQILTVNTSLGLIWLQMFVLFGAKTFKRFTALKPPSFSLCRCTYFWGVLTMNRWIKFTTFWPLSNSVSWHFYMLGEWTHSWQNTANYLVG